MNLKAFRSEIEGVSAYNLIDDKTDKKDVDLIIFAKTQGEEFDASNEMWKYYDGQVHGVLNNDQVARTKKWALLMQAEMKKAPYQLSKQLIQETNHVIEKGSNGDSIKSKDMEILVKYWKHGEKAAELLGISKEDIEKLKNSPEPKSETTKMPNGATISFTSSLEFNKIALTTLNETELRKDLKVPAGSHDNLKQIQSMKIARQGFGGNS